MSGKAVSGGRACEHPVRLSMYDRHMETVEYMWMNIWYTLDLIVGFFHKTAVPQLVTEQNETLLWLAGMNYVKIRTHCYA